MFTSVGGAAGPQTISTSRSALTTSPQRNARTASTAPRRTPRTGRGQVVDTDALLRELESGRLRAVLDVVDPEPLPSDHPLWTAPGVVMTPHVAGDSDAADLRAQRLAGEQLARFARGEPLLNVVRR